MCVVIFQRVINSLMCSVEEITISALVSLFVVHSSVETCQISAFFDLSVYSVSGDYPQQRGTIKLGPQPTAGKNKLPGYDTNLHPVVRLPVLKLLRVWNYSFIAIAPIRLGV